MRVCVCVLVSDRSAEQSTGTKSRLGGHASAKPTLTFSLMLVTRSVSKLSPFRDSFLHVSFLNFFGPTCAQTSKEKPTQL